MYTTGIEPILCVTSSWELRYESVETASNILMSEPALPPPSFPLRPTAPYPVNATLP
jgi:hypothetical protein